MWTDFWFSLDYYFFLTQRLFKRNYRNKDQNPKFRGVPLQLGYKVRLCTLFPTETLMFSDPWFVSTAIKNFTKNALLFFWGRCDVCSSARSLQAGSIQVGNFYCCRKTGIHLRWGQNIYYGCRREHRAAAAWQALLIQNLPKQDSYRAYIPLGCTNCFSPNLCHINRTMVNNSSNWNSSGKRL